jgi:CRISPR-associated protein Csm4
MPSLTLYHLTPKSAFHLGQRGVGLEETSVHLPSDTLFAALVASQVELSGEADSLLAPFQPAQHAPFLLTSAFPRAGRVRFYPALPLSQLNLPATLKVERLKELKRIQFISETIFERASQGEALEAWLPAKDEAGISASDQGLYLHGRSLWLTASEAADLPPAWQQKGKIDQFYRALRHRPVWRVAKVPRVTVDRRRNASNLFYVGRLSFSPGCGWWFGLAWQQAEHPLQGKISQLLQQLEDVGLGGERAAGFGHFAAEMMGTRAWDGPAHGELFVTLSRYHPRSAEELAAATGDEAAAYKLVSVGGWFHSTQAHTRSQAKAQRRRRLWFMAEGSVLRAGSDGPWGEIVDVRPAYDEPNHFPHPVWRYGLACPVRLARTDETIGGS